MIAGYGGDSLIGTKMPYLLRDAGFQQIGSAGVFRMVLPWGTQPEWLNLSAETVRPLLDPDGKEHAAYEAFHDSLPNSIETGHVMMLSWSRRPAE